jgi:hypothetical protein
VKISSLGAILVFGASIAACGPAAPEPTTPAGGPAASASAAAPTGSAPPPAAAPAKWADDLSRPQKAAFMNANVSPRLGKVFKEYDGARYAEFGCKTCHGPNKQEPKDFLPKLTMKGGKITAFEEKPAVAKFMATKVTPEMAAVLGKPAYDPATHQGFGCGGCHTIEMK